MLQHVGRKGLELDFEVVFFDVVKTLIGTDSNFVCIDLQFKIIKFKSGFSINLLAQVVVNLV